MRLGWDVGDRRATGRQAELLRCLAFLLERLLSLTGDICGTYATGHRNRTWNEGLTEANGTQESVSWAHKSRSHRILSRQTYRSNPQM